MHASTGMTRRRHLLAALLLVLPLAAAEICLDTENLSTMSPHNVSLDDVRRHAGECAVGSTCGALGGLIVRKLQGAALTTSIVFAVGSMAALHLDWINGHQLQIVLQGIWRALQHQMRRLTRQIDMDGDGEITIEDTKIAYSKVAPAASKHPAMAGGLVGGFLLGYNAGR